MNFKSLLYKVIIIVVAGLVFYENVVSLQLLAQVGQFKNTDEKGVQNKNSNRKNPIIKQTKKKIPEGKNFITGKPLVSQGKTNSLTLKELDFIAKQPLTPQYENRIYRGPKIKPQNSLSKDFYNKKHLTENSKILKKRVELAINYREQGDINQFDDILSDIITRNNFNQEAAWAALLLGDFDVTLYNLKEAAHRYYIYVVNVHYNSRYGLDGMYKLAVTLDRMGYQTKFEELLIRILNTPDDSSIKDKAHQYLKKRYLELARWYLEEKNSYLVTKYYLKYKNL